MESCLAIHTITENKPQLPNKASNQLLAIRIKVSSNREACLRQYTNLLAGHDCLL